MKRQLAYFVIICVLCISSSVSIAEDSILGEWISVHRTKGGLGSTKIYNREGIVNRTFGALVDYTYKVTGNKLTLSFPDAADIVQTLQIDDTKLILTDGSGNKQELTRLSGDAKYGIIGKWTGDHYTGKKQILHFTESNNCYLAVPMLSAKGSYQIKDDTLTETFEGKGKQVWQWSIKDNVLILTDLTQGNSEKYMRKK
jgi:hypothetical protein